MLPCPGEGGRIIIIVSEDVAQDGKHGWGFPGRGEGLGGCVAGQFLQPQGACETSRALRRSYCNTNISSRSYNSMRRWCSE